MKVSFIIPNYNGENVLGKSLTAVLDAAEESGLNYEIIISDDSSTDKSVNLLKEFQNKNKDKEIKILINSKNQGFSSNVNHAVGAATGNLLILLNTDVIPTKNFINQLLPHFEDENVFAVGCLDESVEGDKIIKRGRGKGFWNRGFLVHSAAFIESGETLWVSGGSGIFRKSLWDKLGGLDPLYNPFYWEDIDISYRARKAGYRVLFEQDSVVRHEHEKGAIRSKFSEKKIKEIAYTNQFIFAWKNSDFSTLIFGIFWLPYHLLKAILSGDTALLNGFISAFGRLPKIIKSRKQVQKAFVLTDKEVISNIK